MAIEQPESTDAFFDAPEDSGGGRFHIDITRNSGGFSGRISFIENSPSVKPRRLFAAWINYSSRNLGDSILIRKAIAQALDENWFAQATADIEPPTEHELNIDTPQYAGDLYFFD